jgi:outer membrane lipoprotein carrier protein
MKYIARRTPIIIIVLFSFFCISTAQKTYSAWEVVDSVQKKYSQIKDAQASFIQKVAMRFSKQDVTQNGTVKIKKGNKYKFVLPQQTLVTDGKTVWMYSAENNQVLVDNFKENSSTFSPEKFLKGFPKDFLPSSMDEKDGKYIVTLAPTKKDSRNQILSMIMTVNVSDWFVSQIEYTDRNQTKYAVTLSNITINQGMNDNEFRFTPSETMDVVDMRKLR